MYLPKKIDSWFYTHVLWKTTLLSILLSKPSYYRVTKCPPRVCLKSPNRWTRHSWRRWLKVHTSHLGHHPHGDEQRYAFFWGGEGLQTWSVGVINLVFSGVQVGFEEKYDCWDVLLDIFALWEKKHLFTIDMVVSLVWCALLKLHHFFHKWVLLWKKNAGYDAMLTVKSDACYYPLHL